MHNSTKHCFTVDKRDALERVAAAAATHAPHQLPLYRAASQGLINLIQPERGAIIPKGMVEKAGRPVLFLIGDDDYAGTGPDGWACAKRLRQWGRRGIVHAAEGKPEHYALAVSGALDCGRLVLVECGTAHQEAWGKFLAPHMPVLNITAAQGLPHPIAPQRGETH